jgi:outer membrane protein OmpA-like peptidoglycan-associated protein
MGMQRITIAALAVALLGASGCATRRFVRHRVSETEAKTTARINDVEKNTSGKINSLEEKHQTDVSRLDEIAKAADNRAGQAIQDAAKANERAGEAGQRAGEAGQKAGEASQRAEEARGVAAKAVSRVESLGDLKLVASDSILFRFGSATLADEETTKLDALAEKAAAKFHTIEVHGFTDPVGDKSYNMNLSSHRAEAVARYLAMKHQLPLHRIQLMGFGPEAVETEDSVKPRERNRLSRRVEVRIFAPEGGSIQASAQ